MEGAFYLVVYALVSAMAIACVTSALKLRKGGGSLSAKIVFWVSALALTFFTIRMWPLAGLAILEAAVLCAVFLPRGKEEETS